MTDFLTHLIDAPLANVVILAGLAFLGIAVIGKISGKIEPNTASRIMAGVLGAVLFVFGVYAHNTSDNSRSQQIQQSATKERESSQQPANEQSGKRTSTQHPESTTTAAQPQVPIQSGQQSIVSRLVGAWSNDNPQNQGIRTLKIWQDNGSVLISVSARQDAGDVLGGKDGGGKGAAIGALAGTGSLANWGTAKATVSEDSASVVWDQNSVVRNMTITPDAARLHVVVNNLYKDQRPARRTEGYFIKSE